jgi:DNA-3-methyladenine glycosylase
MILTQPFYNRPTIKVARELLGNYLIRKTQDGIMVGKIIETESYCGPKDKANHASKGLTPRTAPMFGKCGYSYIYLIYGMYSCFNIVTEKENYPAAVLIRSIQPIKGINLMIKNRNFKFSPLSQRGVGGIYSLSQSKVKKINNLTNGPGKLCQALCLTKKQNNLNITTKKNNFWIETPPEKNRIKIKKGPRVGIDYAGEYKDKLWRFWI